MPQFISSFTATATAIDTLGTAAVKAAEALNLIGGSKNNMAGQSFSDIAMGGNLRKLLSGIIGLLGGKADGGYISGPGSGTSDSIPARLSNGEYVVKAAAVSHWGIGAMDAINSMRAPGFRFGGLVSAAMPSFARGGLVAEGRYALDLRTDGGSFTAMVSGDTMKALSKSAMRAKLKSSGVKPSWYK
jgi:hypothetical protein